MKQLAAVIITKNEETNIERCISSILPVTTEVLVIDSGSTDQTIPLAKSLGAQVIEADWKGYAATKNFGHTQTNADWILSIDADEVLTPALQKELNDLTLEDDTVYTLNRITNYCGQWIKHSGWFPDRKIRVFNKSQIYWQGDFVHETLFLPEQTQVKDLKGLLEHYSYKSLDDHWQRLNKYAELSAQELLHKGQKPSWAKLYLAPGFRFFRTLVLKLGFLDGKAGWIISKRNAYLVHTKYSLLRSYLKAKNE